MCEAQLLGYKSFDFRNSIWKEGYYNFTHERENYNYFANGDTVINSIVYQKLYISGENTITFNVGPPLSPTWTNFSRLEGFIRENTNKQVYFLSNGGTAENLLYDFNIGLGDSIIIPPISNPSYDSAIVVGVDSVLICSTMRNRYLLAPIGIGLLHPLYWIEGVGSSHGLIPRYEYFESGASSVCFSDSICVPCQMVLNTSNLVVREVNNLARIYPNPTTNESCIYFSRMPIQAEILIMNTLGQIILRQKTDNQQEIISFENCDRGFYFVIVKEANEMQTFHLLKQ